MARVDGRTAAKMEVVLDEVFEGVPHGGDHESRKHVAEKLIQSAKKGNVTLNGLRVVGRDAFQQLFNSEVSLTRRDSRRGRWTRQNQVIYDELDD